MVLKVFGCGHRYGYELTCIGRKDHKLTELIKLCSYDVGEAPYTELSGSMCHPYDYFILRKQDRKNLNHHDDAHPKWLLANKPVAELLKWKTFLTTQKAMVEVKESSKESFISKKPFLFLVTISTTNGSSPFQDQQ